MLYIDFEQSLFFFRNSRLTDTPITSRIVSLRRSILRALLSFRKVPIACILDFAAIVLHVGP